MENASKALIMAGSVLIALMIIGALLLMFNNLSSYQEVDTQTTREAQVIEFNNQYLTYHRDNVRGSELYSLLNKVIDYNKRKSTEGIGETEEGQYLAYTPMEIEIELHTDDLSQIQSSSIEKREDHLIKKTSYKASKRENDFEKDVYEIVKNLETSYGADSLNNLVVASEKIFNENISEQERIKNFNNACKSISIKEINEISQNMKKGVYQYAEYVQFKRARFNSSEQDLKYNSQGRIIKMKFTCNGKFE